MRGSPVLRFILLAIFLTVVAVGVRRVTTAAVTDEPAPIAVPTAPVADGLMVPFRLLLSAPATAVEIDTGNPLKPDSGESPITGTLELDPANPRVGLVVRWKSPPMQGEHRFAKLTLEQPGQATLIHVFDADGDIDDLLELPLRATP